jgi:hypothetical protein
MPGPQPAWYRRLPPRLRRVALASDRVAAVPLRAGSRLRALVAALPPALARGRACEVEGVAQAIADGICLALRVSPVRVRVAMRRPPLRGGELQGLYEPARRGRHVVTVWMLTAKRGQVVRFRTFLRTLLHELCHHLDYALLRLPDSLHTQGFYQRESSLFHELGAPSVDAPGPAPSPDAIDSPGSALYTQRVPEKPSSPAA